MTAAVEVTIDTIRGELAKLFFWLVVFGAVWAIAADALGI